MKPKSRIRWIKEDGLVARLARDHFEAVMVVGIGLAVWYGFWVASLAVDEVRWAYVRESAQVGQVAGAQTREGVQVEGVIEVMDETAVQAE